MFLLQTVSPHSALEELNNLTRLISQLHIKLDSPVIASLFFIKTPPLKKALAHSFPSLEKESM